MEPSIFTSLNPLLVASQFTGFNLFTIDRKKWKAIITAWDFLLIFKTILCCIIVHYSYWNSRFEFNVHGSKVVQSSIPKLIYVNLIGYTLIQIWLFLKRSDFVKMLKLLNEIDEKFEDLYLKFDYPKQKRNLTISQIIFTILVTLLSLSVRVCFNFYNLNISYQWNFIQLYVFISSEIIAHHLIVGFIGIRHRFEKLNFFIKNNPHLMGEYLIKKLSSLHFEICELIKAFNEVYGFVILIIVACGFGWFCLFIFMVANLTFKFISEFFFIAIMDIFVNTVHCSVFFYIVKSAEKIKVEGIATKFILYKNLHKNEFTRYCQMLQNFIYQVDNSNMEISSGLFDFNWKFLLKVMKFNLRIYITLI